jgi:hypothetical protein
MMKSMTVLAIAASLTMLSGVALAQTSSPTGPDRPTTQRSGDVNSPASHPGTVGAGPGTTPSPTGDASSSGASTAAGPNSSGSRTDPGAVQSGTSR